MGSLWIAVGIVLFMALVGAVAVPYLPRKVAMQSDERGRSIWAAPRVVAALAYPMLLAGIILLLWISDPEGRSHILMPVAGVFLMIIQIIHLRLTRKR